MKIQSKKMSKTPLVITAALIALLAVAALTYVYAFNGSILGWSNHKTSSNDNPSTSLDKPTDEQIEAGSNIKENGGTDKPPGPVSQPGSSKQNIEVFITAANQNGDTLQIRTQISAVVSTGQCTITLSNTGQVITKTADVQALASTSTCKGFDIPVSELSTGSWQATLIYENDSLTGTASQVITIQ